MDLAGNRPVAGILVVGNPVEAGCSSLVRHRPVVDSRRLVVVVGIGVGRRKGGLCCSLPFWGLW